MLLVLYGATAEPGFKSREYLNEAGFKLIEKYNYAKETPKVSTIFGKRNFVSEEEFLMNTDSLFRYEVGGIQVGFNQRQIEDAVCDRTDSLLTLSTRDMSFLRRIKNVYEDKVCMVYFYIDDSTLASICENLGVDEKESRLRFETGLEIKQCYVDNADIFDCTVMYGGENSVLNYQSVFKQYDTIIAKIRKGSKRARKAKRKDVFVSYAGRDRRYGERIIKALEEKNISVFNEFEDVFAGDNYGEVIQNAISHAKIVAVIVSKNLLASNYVKMELKQTLRTAENGGTIVIPFFVDRVDCSDTDLEKLAYLPSINAFEYDDGEDVRLLVSEIRFILEADETLKHYSEQAEKFHSLMMYDKVYDFRKAHSELCEELYRVSGGAAIDINACVISKIKLADALLDMGKPEEARDTYCEAIEFSNEAKYEDVDIKIGNDAEEKLMHLCAEMGMSKNAAYSFIQRRFSGDALIRELAERFERITTGGNVPVNSSAPASMRENNIAYCGESIMSFFEELMAGEADDDISRGDLRQGYERILNYCNYMGISSGVANTCMERIAELSEPADCGFSSKGSKTAEALKIYLGKESANDGGYDVFISYKSNDEALAKKIYDYLKSNGKEVFFAKETLPKLGKSEYEVKIFEAIDKSKHMILVGSNPDYFKTPWVMDEWSTFNNEIREERKDGNLLLVLSDGIAADKGRLPPQLRQKEIIKTSEFRGKLLSYIW